MKSVDLVDSMMLSSKKLPVEIVNVSCIDFAMHLIQEIRKILSVTNAEKATKLIAVFASQKMVF